MWSIEAQASRSSSLRSSSGGVKDPRVHSAEDLLLQEADDQLPDPTEHAAQVPVSAAARSIRVSIRFYCHCVQLHPDDRTIRREEERSRPFVSLLSDLDSDWNLMLRRFFYQFLLANERNVAKEIRDEYVDTMSKIYYSYFKSYSSRLLKVQVSPPRCRYDSRVMSFLYRKQQTISRSVFPVCLFTCELTPVCPVCSTRRSQTKMT